MIFIALTSIASEISAKKALLNCVAECPPKGLYKNRQAFPLDVKLVSVLLFVVADVVDIRETVNIYTVMLF